MRKHERARINWDVEREAIPDEPSDGRLCKQPAREKSRWGLSMNGKRSKAMEVEIQSRKSQKSQKSEQVTKKTKKTNAKLTKYFKKPAAKK